MTVRIALVGDLNPDYPSHRELEAARALLGPDVETIWFPTDGPMLGLAGCDGVWLAPGSPYANDAAALEAIRWAREHGIPFLGTCGGMQYAVLEFVRNVIGREAGHAEITGEHPTNAVVPLSCDLHGQERIVTPVPGTAFASLTGGQPFPGMHYCRYAAAPEVVDELTRHGWVVEATAPDAGVEVLRLAPHPFFVVSMFQPQIGSSQGVMHPLVHAFVDQARSRAAVRERHEAATAFTTEFDRIDALPRVYAQQMRSAIYRWWRPLFALGMGLLAFILIQALITVPFVLAGAIDLAAPELTTSTWGNLYLNLGLAAMIPAAFVGLWAGFGGRWRRVLSVTGRLRWGYLLRSMALITPLWLVSLTVGNVVTGQFSGPRPQDWIGLLVVSLFTTPLQATGEEIFLRGWLAQSIGAWFAKPVVATLVAGGISTVVFVALHGSLDPWIIADIGSLAIAAAYLSWRTGGLEAAIAIHVVNNLLITFAGTLFGGLEASYVDGEAVGDPVSALTSVILMICATLVLTWLAKRDGLAPAKRGAPALG